MKKLFGDDAKDAAFLYHHEKLRVVSQCVLYERWCYSSLEAVRALEAPFRGYARRLFLGGHKIEEMLFRTFVFASVLNDAQSLLSSLKPANSGRPYANADFCFCFFGLRFVFFLQRKDITNEGVGFDGAD